MVYVLGGGNRCKTDVSNLVTAVENFLGMESRDIRYENISGENMKTAGNIFVYLYFNIFNEHDHLDICPFIEYNNRFSNWSSIYHVIFNSNSADKIILTLNRMMKTNPLQSKFGKVGDVLKRIAITLASKYVDIHNILPQNDRNSSMMHNFQSLESYEGKYRVSYNIGPTLLFATLQASTLPKTFRKITT